VVAQTHLSVPLYEHCLVLLFSREGHQYLHCCTLPESKPSVEEFIKCLTAVFGLCSEITDRTFLITVFICVTEEAITMSVNNLENLYIKCDLSLEAISFCF